MARTTGRLSALAVSNAKAPGMYADGGGLYLQVTTAGARSWLFRYRRNGRRREMGLGSLAIVSLADARGLALDARKAILEGHDPIEGRRADRASAIAEAANAITFETCAKAYIDSHKAGWRNPKHAAQWPATLQQYVYPVFGRVAVQAVDTAAVLKVLDPIWRTKTETAARIRGRIESVLDWATARGYRSGENPARWRGCLESLLPPQSKVRPIQHHAALPYAQVGVFIASLRQQEGSAARALEFTILTGTRTSEVVGARWSEFDLERSIWVIPPTRIKAGQEHRVPLSQRALEILRVQNALSTSEWVFNGRSAKKPLSTMAMLMLLRRMGRSDLTVHGFRSTFRDWVAEQTTYPREVAEQALAHTIGDKVEAAYRRGDLFEKRRRLMTEWARYCDVHRLSGKVVPIAKKKA